MKKAEKDEVIKVLRHCKTPYLEKVSDTLAKWAHTHAMKKNSWFWTDNGNRNTRKAKERYYSFSEHVKIGSIILYYSSSCSMSRKNVYWYDNLEFQSNSIDSDVNFTFADVAFLMDEISAIMRKRAIAAA